MKGLADQVAIVTGAASGIGRELAKQLSASGCHLALLDIDETALKSLWHELDSKRSAISIHRIDIANEDAVNQIVDEAIRIHGRISILINNAAISMSAPFQEVWFEDFRRVIATNLWGAIYLCRYTLPFLSQEKEALIVNVLSGFASLGFPNKTAYCTSKAALLSFSKALYTERLRDACEDFGSYPASCRYQSHSKWRCLRRVEKTERDRFHGKESDACGESRAQNNKWNVERPLHNQDWRDAENCRLYRSLVSSRDT